MAKCPGGLSNPFEYRELMKAVVGYSDKTVEQVLAAQKERSGPKAKPNSRTAPSPAAAPKKSELDKLASLKAGGKPRPPTSAS